MRFIRFSERTEEIASVGVLATADQCEDVTKEILDEGRTLVSPLRMKQPQRTRVDEHPNVATDIDIDEIQRWLGAPKPEML
jgi:hypothetical protein